MKATLKHEQTIYTVTVEGVEFPGMCVMGELGPIKHLRGGANGSQMYVADVQNSGLFEFFKSKGDTDVVLVLASRDVHQAIETHKHHQEKQKNAATMRYVKREIGEGDDWIETTYEDFWRLQGDPQWDTKQEPKGEQP